MARQTTLPIFRQKRINPNLVVPRRCELPIAILKASSLAPAALNSFYNLKNAWNVPIRDTGGPLIIQTTETEFYIAILWCVLAGYWNWVLATSMMKQWLYQYEIKHAITRLLMLIIISWCLSSFIHSLMNPNDPVLIQIVICFVLFLSNFLKLTFNARTKYSQKIEDVLPTTTQLNLNSKAVRILLLPLLVVMGLSAFGLTGQIHHLQYGSVLLMSQERFALNTTIVDPIFGNGVTILVLIFSSWTSQAAERRKLLRETTLQWMGQEEDTTMIYRFVVGQPPSSNIQSWLGPDLIAESEKYHDILIVPAPDRLLSDKSKKVFEAFKYASSVVQYDYLVKTDDDVFVRYDVLNREMNDLGQKDNYWKGFVNRNMPVNYYNPTYHLENDYSMPVLPTFVSGILYILSRNVVNLITQTNYPQRYIDKDDVNVALWLFGFDIEPIHDKRIQDDVDVCEEDFIAKRLNQDKFKSQLLLMYDHVLTDKRLCTGLNPVKKCALCYSCHGKSNDWRANNLECDTTRGVTLKRQAEFKTISGSVVKDALEPSIIGVNDEWIVKDILSARTSIYSEDEANWHLLYWVCWTSEPSTFTDRHWRAIEMVWIHEPEAAIFMISNTLPKNFFQEYTQRGYNINVVSFNKESLLKWHWYFGPGTQDWILDWDKWENGRFFYWHLTDYIRCLLLYNYGGTYMDMDALWIRIPPNPNLEFIGSDYSSIVSDRKWTLDNEGLYLPQGLMRFKRGWKLFREMAEGAFSAYNYDPECFNCGGPKAITSYVRDRRAVLEDAGMTILPREILYPFSYLEIHKLLQPNPLAEQDMKNIIEPLSWNIHLFGKMTNHLPVQPNSVIDYVFKKFDLDIPHRDTSTHKIISSTHSMEVPMKLIGPRDYIYRAVSARMLEDDKGQMLIFQPVPGKFQGIHVIYVRGGPSGFMPEVMIELETTIGYIRLNNATSFEKRTTHVMKHVTMKEVNRVLNSIEYSPAKLMAANGGRDRLKVSIVYDNGIKTEKEQLQIAIIVVEPEEEDEKAEIIEN
ncbi:galactosyltransferase-domain-containing protein [Cokeromyces recurvatus]|uniref:galactosyltransferase-domain-containing protein n=1 Tax=Cokeromyces recurvatus TaxID=90255 RepID=UPI00221E8055|nr:galactosyltransferase-domain-containing protein [Cokeromyces recurvatus]KAI7903796.1 galactosyltransferase-domain-containing protein [Cokeromyces recurvatus]